MSKRRVFDIDFDPEAAVPAGTEESDRRGPMAAAISENADALQERQVAEAAIRAENDRLAHEYVALKRDGGIMAKVPIHQISATKLTRDRGAQDDHEMGELMSSIQAVGLSNPIQVEDLGNGTYELIQGFRRWTAFTSLDAQFKDGRFAHIPAVLIAKGEALDQLYRRMVDENLIRKDISFYEMAQLALSYAREMELRVSDAIDALYASTGRQKRSYIRHFAEIVRRLGPHLRYPEGLPRALGLRLGKALEADPKLADRIGAVLAAEPNRTAQEETEILSRALVAPATPARAPAPPRSQAKQTLKLSRRHGAVKVSAAEGKVEVITAHDFGGMDPRKLELAIRAFLDAADL